MSSIPLGCACACPRDPEPDITYCGSLLCCRVLTRLYCSILNLQYECTMYNTYSTTYEYCKSCSNAASNITGNREACAMCQCALCAVRGVQGQTECVGRGELQLLPASQSVARRFRQRHLRLLLLVHVGGQPFCRALGPRLLLLLVHRVPCSQHHSLPLRCALLPPSPPCLSLSLSLTHTHTHTAP